MHCALGYIRWKHFVFSSRHKLRILGPTFFSATGTTNFQLRPADSFGAINIILIKYLILYEKFGKNVQIAVVIKINIKSKHCILINKRVNKQTSKQINKQTNKQTNKINK